MQRLHCFKLINSTSQLELNKFQWRPKMKINILFAGLKGGAGGGGGGPNGPGFTYSFQGDPHAMFAEFFGGRSPFEHFFGRGMGGDEDMDVDEPFASFGLGAGHQFGGRMQKKQDPPVSRAEFTTV